MSFIVAIDGPAGSGKGTITKLVAEKLGFITIDTGAMYRCVTLAALKNNVAPTDEINLKQILNNIKIEMKKVDGNQKVYLNGEDVTKQIRTTEIDKNVSAYSAIPYVRAQITPLQRKMGESQNVIMEGRDIGTVVFPNADVKIFLDASDEEIAKRRYKQNLERGMDVTYEQILEDIKRRNELDSHREIAPLKKAEDAVYIDSSNLTIDEVVEKVIGIIEEVRNTKKRNNKENKKEKTKFSEKFKPAIKWVVRGAIYIWFKIYYQAEIKGLENVPKTGSIIFCGNHRSYADPPLMVVTAKRDMKFLAKEELYENKFLAFLGWAFEAIPVKRDEKDVYAIKKSLKDLKEGKCIALFPEGTRNGLEKGEKVKDGVAFFAVRSGAKVVPCGIKGGTKEHHKITITYGKPLDYSEYKGCKDKETLDKITKEIMDNIIELTK